jgi:arylsulfatase A-like enzyme
LEDNESEQSEHDCIYYEFYEKGGKQSILKDGWKLVRLNLTRPDALIEELYFLPDDESESRNLADVYPEKLRELKRLADSVRTESPFFKWKPEDRPKSGK